MTEKLFTGTLNHNKNKTKQIQETQCPTADQQWDKRGEVSRISGVGGEGGLRKILRWVERPGEKPYTVL